MNKPAGADRRTAASLAARVLARVPALTDDLVRTIEEQNPGYRALNVVSHDDLWRSCHDNLTRVLELVAECPGRSGPPELDERYDAARATGRLRAEQRMPLDDILRSFRIGGRLVWEALIDEARADRTADADSLLNVATRVWEIVDSTSAQVAAAYHVTEGNLLRGDEQRRAALWEGLLHGRAKELAFAYEASRIIGVPVEGPFLAVATDTSADPAALHRRLARVAVESAWQVRADTLVGLVALRDPAPDGALAALREPPAPSAGVSLVVDGLAEADDAYRQAVLARRTVPPGHPGIVALEERLPEALLLNAPALADRLVRRWLGKLLAVPAAERRLLLGTLDIWIATGGSIRHTAEAACCHRNTVLNRLQRIQSITGHDFADPSCQVELALALRACALFPAVSP